MSSSGLCWVQLGVYSEVALQRLDLILAEAGRNGVRIIFPFVNFWPDLGGMQWYVDQVRLLLHLLYGYANHIQSVLSPYSLTGCEISSLR